MNGKQDHQHSGIPSFTCEERDALTNVEFRLADWPGHPNTKAVELWSTGPKPIMVGVLYPTIGGFNFTSKYEPRGISVGDAISIMCMTMPGLKEHIEAFARERHKRETKT